MTKMCDWKRWKKIIFSMIVIAVFVRILYIGIYGELNKEYYTSMEYDFSEFTKVPCRDVELTFVGGRDKLDSLELMFTNMAGDREYDLTLVVQKDGRIIYQTNASLTDADNWEWKKVYVNMKPEAGAEYRLSMNAEDAYGQAPMMLVVERGAEEIVRSCQAEEKIAGTVAVNFGYLQSPGYFDCAISISLWMLFIAGVYFFFAYFERLIGSFRSIWECLAETVRPDVLTAVLEVLGGMIIVNSSGIEFQRPTKILIYIISLLAVVKREDKKRYVNEMADMPVKRVFLYLLYAYAAFALTGQRIWIYPLNAKITMAGLFVFLVTVFWFVPVIDTLLYVLEMAGRNASGGGQIKKSAVYAALYRTASSAGIL